MFVIFEDEARQESLASGHHKNIGLDVDLCPRYSSDSHIKPPVSSSSTVQPSLTMQRLPAATAKGGKYAAPAPSPRMNRASKLRKQHIGLQIKAQQTSSGPKKKKEPWSMKLPTVQPRYTRSRSNPALKEPPDDTECGSGSLPSNTDLAIVSLPHYTMEIVRNRRVDTDSILREVDTSAQIPAAQNPANSLLEGTSSEFCSKNADPEHYGKFRMLSDSVYIYYLV